MHADLEAILAADEECRSRVTLAEQRRERGLESARADRDAAIARRTAEARETLDRELQSIRSEGDARLHALQEQQVLYRAALMEAAEKKFDDAVQLYLRIVCTPEER